MSLIVPALNEAQCIAEVVHSVPRQGETFELVECIVVDNGSTDATTEVAAAAGARVVQSKRGYGNAMFAGVNAASPQSLVLVFADGDGADDLSAMDALVGPIARGEADFVLASRMRGTREPGSMLPSQVLAGHVVGWLTKVFYGHRYTDMCAFRAIRRGALDAMFMSEMTYGWNLEMQLKAIKLGLRIKEVPVHYRRRAAGMSKVSGNMMASVKTLERIVRVFLRVRRGRQ